MDKIIAKGLRFKGCHGVLPSEKQIPLEFLIDVELWLDLSVAGKTDDIANTVDYSQVWAQVKEIVENRSYNLIEALAEHIARTLLNGFRVITVRVTVYKPQAPVEGDFDYFAVSIARSKE